MANSDSGRAAQLSVPVSFGEMVDKITILEIKAAHISAPEKLVQVEHELRILNGVLNGLGIDPSSPIFSLMRDLSRINGKLWQIEDDIRECERQGDFGETFIALARSVYRTNDERARVKLALNLEFGSDIVEVKSYAAY